MKTYLLCFFLLFLGVSVDAQPDSSQLGARLLKIEGEMGFIHQYSSANSQRVAELARVNADLLIKVDSLHTILGNNTQSIEVLRQEIAKQESQLHEQIQLESTKSATQIGLLDSSMDRKSLYWIVAFLGIIVLCGIIFLLLKRELANSQISFSDRLARTRQELEQEAIVLDEKLIQLLATQMELAQQGGQDLSQMDNTMEIDHSLALKVADEVVRIEKNLNQMEEGTKGVKQLVKAVRRIRDNFAANGYEMVEMLGQPYDEGMRVSANFRPDEGLSPGERIITRIIKPQINYLGVMIQSAQIEVSQGE